MKRAWKHEDVQLGMIGSPGRLDRDKFEQESLLPSRILKRNIFDKAGYMIEVRNLTGPEKSFYFSPEKQKRFRRGIRERRSD